MYEGVTTFRILVIDDTPAIHDDFRKVLATTAAPSALSTTEAALFGTPVEEADSRAFQIDSAMQGQNGVEKVRTALLEGKPYAMAFVDMRMPPGWNGVQTIRELWKVDPNLQIAICTAYSDYTPEQIASELKINGRMLLLRKPFDGLEVRQLAAALCDKWQAARRQVDLEQIVAARTEELKRAALHDALTGLPNRVLFADRLNCALKRSKREPGYKFAVLFVDADEFKVVNDSLGHEAGDQLLLQIAERLNNSIRGLDSVARVENNVDNSGSPLAARLGGDEFAILLDGLRGDSDCARVAQRLLEETIKPYVINGHSIRSTISIGITTSTLPYLKAEDMLRDADTAMYCAKRQGRSRFVIFDQQMHAAALARLTFEADLRAAIDQDQIHLHYQPIVEIASGKIIGFEALARWDHAVRGSIPPTEFVPLAEETGLIIPLGVSLMEKACRQLAAWQASSPDLRNLTVSINVSRKQLVQADLVNHIQRILNETGVHPSTVKLEITESSVMNDTRASLDVLKRIQELNVQLHVDDFGTGYSSLSCLQSFPMNGIKIDRGFINEIVSRPDHTAILSAIVKLAQTLNLPLVSEGVETLEQSALLEQLGCQYAQGFLFAKPMDAGGATQFIRRHVARNLAA